jgi:hypothetical protein
MRTRDAAVVSLMKFLIAAVAGAAAAELRLHVLSAHKDVAVTIVAYEAVVGTTLRVGSAMSTFGLAGCTHSCQLSL